MELLDKLDAFVPRMYTTHDLDSQTGWDMVDYNCFSSDDMVNWRDEGIVFNMSGSPWAE